MADHSRIARLGARAAEVGEPEVLARLDSGCTHVSFDPSLWGAQLTLRITLTTLRRMPGRVHLDPTGLSETELEQLRLSLAAIDSARPLEVGEEPPPPAVHLHIGTQTPSVGVIRVVPDGYGMQLARDAETRIVQARPPHALGCVTAAAFGVAEVFKDLAPVVEERRVDHPYLAWCPVTLSADLTAAPLQSRPLRLDLALAGCGAIGTAAALILAELDATGNVFAMDRQIIGPENLATYSLGTEEDVALERRKVDIVGHVLAAKYQIRKRHDDLETLVEDVDADKEPWPRLVLGGLDSGPARHAVQLLWPDRLIDAATGDTAVGLHDVRAGSGPCLFCFFPGGGAESSQARVAKVTGLSLDLVGRGDDVLQEHHLAELDPERQAKLQPFVGQKMCNVASTFGLVEGAGEFGAAVTFVALQAACLLIGRFLASELELDLPNFVLYDSLLGPALGDFQRRKAVPGCRCQERAANIEKVRSERAERG